jgi:hypothetical protein
MTKEAKHLCRAAKRMLLDRLCHCDGCGPTNARRRNMTAQPPSDTIKEQS